MLLERELASLISWRLWFYVINKWSVYEIENRMLTSKCCFVTILYITSMQLRARKLCLLLCKGTLMFVLFWGICSLRVPRPNYGMSPCEFDHEWCKWWYIGDVYSNILIQRAKWNMLHIRTEIADWFFSFRQYYSQPMVSRKMLLKLYLKCESSVLFSSYLFLYPVVAFHANKKLLFFCLVIWW